MTDSHFHIDRRALSRADMDAASVTAARGFYTDPFFEFLSPKSRQRNNALSLFFRTAMIHLGPQGQILTVRDDRDRIVGVSAWLPPGGYPQPIPTQLAQIPGTFRTLARRPRALVDGNTYLQAIAKAHPKEPHWYLYLLVADPETQRRGVGAMIMQEILPTVDEQGVGSYLETQKLDNIAYYRRFGYEHRDTLTPVTGGPPLYTMWRPAK